MNHLPTVNSNPQIISKKIPEKLRFSSVKFQGNVYKMMHKTSTILPLMEGWSHKTWRHVIF